MDSAGARAAGVWTPEVSVVGGAGHVGLPLALSFTARGRRVVIQDVDRAALAAIAAGRMPFLERGGEELLGRALGRDLLRLSVDPGDAARAPAVVIVIGTPVDEFLNPRLDPIRGCLDGLRPHLRDGHLIVLRSTVHPGATELLSRHLREQGLHALLAYCPERVVQGHAIEEGRRLPQIVSGTTPQAEEAAARLFAVIAPEVVRLPPREAELAKLFSNAYRYIQFAVSNQLFLIADAAGCDYYRVLEAMKRGYPRLQDVPPAGFAAGPCLFKDTMQLAALCRSQFSLGMEAMMVNEGMPLAVVERLERRFELPRCTVGLLGMAFKADSDDRRVSLSYKLKRLLSDRAAVVLTTDPHVTDDPGLLPLGEVIARSDVLVLCVPHGAYRGLDLNGRTVVDIWNFWGTGTAAGGQAPLTAADERAA